MVKWMKEHKKFWAQRLHTGDRAVEQLAKHMESGSCCEQFDSYLVLKLGSEVFTPSKNNAYLLPTMPRKQPRLLRLSRSPSSSGSQTKAMVMPTTPQPTSVVACQAHAVPAAVTWIMNRVDSRGRTQYCKCGNPTCPGCGCGFEYEPADDDEPPVYWVRRTDRTRHHCLPALQEI